METFEHQLYREDEKRRKNEAVDGIKLANALIRIARIIKDLDLDNNHFAK